MEFAILDFIQSVFKSPIMDKIMIFITSLGNEGIIYYVILALLLINKKTRKIGVVMGISMIFYYLIGNVTLKPLVARTRPYDINTAVDIIVHKPSSYSFPSGHTAQAFSVAFAFLFMKYKYTIPMFIFACLIAFSRLYLYVHFPTDILGGILIGLVSAYLAVKIYHIVESKKGA